MSYLSDFTTPEAVIRLLAKADPGVTPTYAAAEYADFYTLLTTDLIPQASRQFQLETGRTFVPYREAKQAYFFDLLDDRRNLRNRLFLPDDLLSVSEVKWLDTVLQATDWRPLPSNSYPILEIGFSPYLGQPFDLSDYNNSITITGIWGYHEQPAQAWTPVETIAGSITNSATTITVANSSAYELLSYIRIEAEYLQVTARTTGMTQTITVKRGVNGTTAAAHSAFVIERFNIMPDVAYAVTRLAAWAYQARSLVGSIDLPDGATVVPQMPLEVRNIAKKYTRLLATSV